MLQEDGAANIHELPLLKHRNRGKGHVMMAFHSDVGAEKMIPDGKPDKMGQQVQDLFNLETFKTKWTQH